MGSCGGGVGSEMCLWSHVVVEWATARWVLSSGTLVLSCLLLSLYIAYSLLYRFLSASQFFFSFYFFIHFSTTGFYIFLDLHFFKKIYMNRVKDS